MNAFTLTLPTGTAAHAQNCCHVAKGRAVPGRRRQSDDSTPILIVMPSAVARACYHVIGGTVDRQQDALGPDFEAAIQKITAMTTSVLKSVAAQLPRDFPGGVSGPIFDGLLAQVKRLNATE